MNVSPRRRLPSHLSTHLRPLPTRPRSKDCGSELVSQSVCMFVRLFWHLSGGIDMARLLMMPNEWVGPSSGVATATATATWQRARQLCVICTKSQGHAIWVYTQDSN